MTTDAMTRAIALIEAERSDRPELVQLAEAASLATRVEPHLLRRLRIELCAGADVGVEADLWFSDFVETIGPHYVVLDPDVVAVLRRGLGDRPERLDQIDRITREEHADSPPSLRLEEQLNLLAVRGGANLRSELNGALRPALRTLADGGAAARDLAQWSLRALPRLFPGALDCENGMALTLAASAVLGQRRIVDQIPESDLPIEQVAWALPTDGTTEMTRVWMSLVADGVRIDEAGPDDQAIELPATTPLLLELSWPTADGSRVSTLVQAEAGRTIELSDRVTEVTIRTLTGDQYLLAAVAEASDADDRSSTAPPLFTLEMLPAEHGTAIWVEYGTAAKPRRILVDGGTPNTVGALTDRIKESLDDDVVPRFELIVSTHGDQPNIGGLVEFLDRGVEGLFTTEDLWTNVFTVGADRSTSSESSFPSRSTLLARLVDDGDLPVNEPWSGGPVVRSDRTVQLPDGMSITVLGPTEQDLDRLSSRLRSDSGPSDDEAQS